MLFNSYEFLFAFLPCVVALFYLLTRLDRYDQALSVLTLSSFFFYAWWDLRYLPLLLVSIGANFLIAQRIFSTVAQKRSTGPLVVGVLFNLGLLCYYKYANFFMGEVTSGFSLDQIIRRILWTSAPYAGRGIASE